MSGNDRYETPAEGATDWHLPINANFDALDTDVEVRDADANRADYAPKAGAKFLAVDTGDVYVGDGDAWNHLGTLANLAGDVYVQVDEPSSPSKNDLWIRPGDRSTDDGTVSDGTDGEQSSTDGPVLVESGENFDLSRYAGDVDYFGKTTSSVVDGTASIRARNATHGGYQTIVTTDLDVAPSVGDTIRCDVRVDSNNTYGAVLFGVQSEQAPWPGYRLRIDTGASPGVELEKIADTLESNEVSDGNTLSGKFDDTGLEPVIGETYTVEIRWNDDGTMPFSVTASDGSVLCADSSPVPDTEYADGGIGFMSCASWKKQYENSVTFDNYRIV